ncbi:hypothetical protein C9374_004042 [Naegleria lovaniensis]|uniref:Protein kinase domain-containing protein n=1 Tax=Naegleria lovaniensis TaxID=51637 RepID=A0AA88H093_NAELO|nr:uncharacterized protein C9374_004042 [Naegleria lovaniensis]KAG2394278.1 hypothetical protein C9374_004042 [Naegleria lovaniensis]
MFAIEAFSPKIFWNYSTDEQGPLQNPTLPSKPATPSPYTLTTLAGMSNVSGDGGPSVNAQLNHPRGLFCHYNMISNNYELYFCDTNNIRIRKINLQNGIIETVISDRDNVLPSVNDGRLSNLAFPTSLALSSENITEGNVSMVKTTAFVSDGTKIIKASWSELVSCSPGTTCKSKIDLREIEVPINFRNAASVTAYRNPKQKYRTEWLFVDSYNAIITKNYYEFSGPEIVPTRLTLNFAGSSSKAFTGFVRPEKVFADVNNDRLYVTDLDAGVVYQFSSILSGTTLTLNHQFPISAPGGMSFTRNGTILISGRGTSRLYEISKKNELLLYMGSRPGFDGDGGRAKDARINSADDLNYCDGNLYIADTFNSRIRKVSFDSNIIETFAGNYEYSESGIGTSVVLNDPTSLSYNPQFPNEVLIADTNSNVIRSLDLTTNNLQTVAGNYNPGRVNSSNIIRPQCAVRGPNRELYICDTYNHRVLVKYENGTEETIAGIIGSSGYSGDGYYAKDAKLYTPTSIALNKLGEIFIADSDNNRIRKIDKDGIISTVIGIGDPKNPCPRSSQYIQMPVTTACVIHPTSLQFDNEGYLYLSDVGHHMIRKASPDLTTVYIIAGNGLTEYVRDSGITATSASLFSPRGLFVTNNGDVLIADTRHHLIRIVTKKDSLISTIIGTGLRGDSNSFENATLNNPFSVIVTKNNDIIFCENSNNKIKKLSCTQGLYGVLCEPQMDQKIVIFISVIAATVALAICCVITIVAVQCYYNMKKRKSFHRLREPLVYQLEERLLPISNVTINKTKKLGSGSSGTVYLGYWDEVLVAAKKVEKSTLTEREVEFYKKLRNPHIVTFISTNTNGREGSMYLIMEYMGGGSLRKYIYSLSKGTEKCTFVDKLCLLKGVLIGLKYLHENNITHRDLKPDNILLDERHQIAKICDFGTTLKTSANLQEETTLGTPAYLPLDGVTSKKPSTKVDVYAFGKVMWELLFERSLEQASSSHEAPIPFNSAVSCFTWISDNPLVGIQYKDESNEDECFKQIEAHSEIVWEYCKVMKDCLSQNVEQRPTIFKILNLCKLWIGRLDESKKVVSNVHGTTLTSSYVNVALTENYVPIEL